jgi:hypothetical protein
MHLNSRRRTTPFSSLTIASAGHASTQEALLHCRQITGSRATPERAKLTTGMLLWLK